MCAVTFNLCTHSVIAVSLGEDYNDKDDLTPKESPMHPSTPPPLPGYSLC